MTVERNQENFVWEFEERDIAMTPVLMILVRLMTAKIKNHERLLDILRNLSVRAPQPG
jgi:hypothetical protein